MNLSNWVAEFKRKSQSFEEARKFCITMGGQWNVKSEGSFLLMHNFLNFLIFVLWVVHSHISHDVLWLKLVVFSFALGNVT